MKRTKFLILTLTLGSLMACSGGSTENAGDQAAHDHAAPAPAAEGAKKTLSPHVNAMGNIGEAHIHVDYSSPSVRGRVIWGGLVPYGQVWSTGAHNATSVEFSRDVRIAGQLVPKGKYGFFTIPGQEEWTVILNKNFEQHLADDYDQALDVLRFPVKPQPTAGLVESLTYAVEPKGEKEGLFSVKWENVQISFPVSAE